MDRGLTFELIDFRTEEERAVAMIAGSRLLSEEAHDYLLGLDRNTTIVFQCHHGIRSQVRGGELSARAWLPESLQPAGRNRRMVGACGPVRAAVLRLIR